MSETLPDKAPEPGAVEGYDDTGLEDFGVTDFVMPRLNIDHSEAVFIDSLTGQRFPEVTCVMLGLVKQRILWDDEVREGDVPMCKSYDFHAGHPNEHTFPWSASGFDKGSHGEDGTLPCEACALKEWGSHPKRETPWCSEQHTFPLLQILEDGGEVPALLTVQRSAIKPSKAYLSGFARSRTPLFTVKTKISLTAQKRGSVSYAVPSFVRLNPTDDGQWEFYKDQYRQIRTFIQTPPSARQGDNGEEEEDKPKPKSKPRTGKGAKGAEKPAATATAPVDVDDDEEDPDDLPF